LLSGAAGLARAEKARAARSARRQDLEMTFMNGDRYHRLPYRTIKNFSSLGGADAGVMVFHWQTGVNLLVME
jgi:hypothetical protein